MASEASQTFADSMRDLPTLPEDWRWTQLSELVDPSRGICYGIVQPGRHDVGGVPMVNTGDVFNGGVAQRVTFKVSRELHSKFRRSILRGGELLVTLVGANFGRVAVAPPSYAGFNCSRAVGVVPALGDVEYLMFALRSPIARHLMDTWANTTAQPTFNLKDLANLPIPMPPAAERERIKGVLLALDARIEILHQTNATLEAIAQALFKSWFVDFDPVRANAEGREPVGMDAATAELFPSEFDESELGLIPKGWPIRAVRDVATIVRGRSYKSSELADSDTALVTLKSFNRGGGFRRDGFKPYTGPCKPEQEVFEGDCIVAHTDVTQQAELIGRSAVVTLSPLYSRLVASLDVGIVRPKSGDMTSVFLSALLSGDRYVSHIKGYTSGTTVLHLSKDGLPGFKFACPSPSTVEAYSELAFALFRRQAMNIAAQESLAELRDTLLPRLISGKLRLPEVSAVLEEAAA